MVLLRAPLAETDLALLGRAAAMRGARYVGTRRVDLFEGERRKVDVERVIRDGSRLRIEFPSGSRFEGQTVIEVPGSRYLLDPARKEIRRLPTRSDEGGRRLARFAALVKSGVLTLAGGDGGSVAGFATRRLVLSRERRPLLALSIEPRTAVVLRRESFTSADGERGPVGSYVFTRFEPRERIDGANFALPRVGYRSVEPIDDLRALAARERIPLAILPPATGYRLEGARARRTRGGTVLASFYSGSGKRLTLFAASGELPELPARGSGSGRSPLGVALYRWRVGTVSYGLLGEESSERLRLIAGRLVFP